VFQRDFEKLRPLIAAEWPEVDAAELAATGGDLDAVIKLISDTVGKTRTQTRRLMAELIGEASTAAGGAARAGTGGVGDRLDDEIERVKKIVERLEARSKHLVDYAKTDLKKDARETVEQNLLLSLIVAVGLGFLLGILTRGRS
jgi:hypothetical protein